MMAAYQSYVAGVNMAIEDRWAREGFIVQRGPGGVYYSKDLAGAAATGLYADDSVTNSREYTGAIFQNSDGTYSYTAALAIGAPCTRESGCSVRSIDYAGAIGNYHTHPFDLGAGGFGYNPSDPSHPDPGSDLMGPTPLPEYVSQPVYNEVLEDGQFQKQFQGFGTVRIGTAPAGASSSACQITGPSVSRYFPKCN